MLSEWRPRRSGRTQKYAVRRRIQLGIIGGVDVGWKEMVCTFEMEQGKTAARDSVFYHSRSPLFQCVSNELINVPYLGHHLYYHPESTSR